MTTEEQPYSQYKTIPHFKSLKMQKKERCTPGAIAHEDTFPDGQSAVVPHQQKVEDFISDSKHTHTTRLTLGSRHKTVIPPGYQSQTFSALLPIVEKEEAGYCSEHQDYRHVQLELFIFVLIGESRGRDKS